MISELTEPKVFNCDKTILNSLSSMQVVIAYARNKMAEMQHKILTSCLEENWMTEEQVDILVPPGLIPANVI